MTLEEALEVLGVPFEVSEKDLKKAYRRLSRDAHPDMPDGDDERQAELNRAFEMVEAAISTKRMLVPKALQEPLQRLELAMASEQAMRQAEQVTKSAKTRSLRRMTDLKWVTLVMAGLSAVLAWLADSGSGPFAAPLSQDAVVSAALKTMALVFGAIAAALQFLTNVRSHAIDSYTAELDDKQTCAAELAAALNYHNRTIMAAADLDLASEQMRRGLSPLPFLGHFPRRRLLILKAVGHGLLEEITSEDISPDRDVRYRLKFQPIRFGSPRDSTSQGDESLSRQGISAIPLLFSTIVTTAFTVWLTFRLFAWQYSGWGWFTGILAAIFGLGMIGLIIELVTSIRHDLRKL